MPDSSPSPLRLLLKRLFNRQRPAHESAAVTVGDAAEAAATPRSSGQQLRDDVANLLLSDLLRERRSERRWKWFRRIAISGAGLLLFDLNVTLQAQQFGLRLIPRNELIGVVHLRGAISAQSEAAATKVIGALRKAFERDNVRAVVLAIDSPGGQPAEAERIAEAITALKAKHPKPITAVIDNTGASAAYLVALRADRIVAGHYSLVGSVGAIIQGWDAHRWLERNDVRQRIFASGEHKNMLNPYTDMSADSARKAQAIVDALGSRFVGDVRLFRHDKLKLGAQLGTGEVWTGDDALRFGLIDQIGTFDSIVAEHGTLRTFDFGPNPDSGLFPLGGFTHLLDQLNAISGRVAKALSAGADVRL